MAGQDNGGARGGLARALMDAQRALADGVEKGSTAEIRDENGRLKHSYRYASVEEMIAGCRAALLGAGLLLTRVRWSYDVPADAEGVPLVVSHFRLLFPETGEVEEAEVGWPIVTGRGRPEDKAVGGALSTTWTYYLRDLLLVAREDGDEVDKRGEDPEPRARRAEPSAPAPARPAATRAPAAPAPPAEPPLTAEDAALQAAALVHFIEEEPTAAAMRAHANDPGTLKLLRRIKGTDAALWQRVRGTIAGLLTAKEADEAAAEAVRAAGDIPLGTNEELPF